MLDSGLSPQGQLTNWEMGKKGTLRFGGSRQEGRLPSAERGRELPWETGARVGFQTQEVPEAH